MGFSEYFLIWLLGMPVYSFIMGFAWPAEIDEGYLKIRPWKMESIFRITFGTIFWPIACLICLPFLSYRWGESRRKKFLQEDNLS